MNYRNFILAGLFLPIFGYAQGGVDRLEELKELRDQIMDEIKEQRTIISEGNDFLEYFSLRYRREVSRSAEERQKKLEENGGKIFEVNDLEQIISDENNLIYYEFVKSLSENHECNNLFLHELICPRDIKKRTPFSIDTLFIVNAALEQKFVSITQVQYLMCLQELTKIDKEISELKKTRDTQ